MTYKDFLKLKFDLDSFEFAIAMLKGYFDRNPDPKQKEQCSLEELLSFCPLKIKDMSIILDRLKQCAELRRDWNVSELARKLKVSRPTIYNWTNYNYLIWHGRKIDVIRTSELWEQLRNLTRQIS